jgi:HEAT repeat protein
LAFLVSAVGKTSLWPSTRSLEMRLAAVQGLESMATPEAAGALGAATQLRGKKVRRAAADALARIQPAGAPK